jgi:TetR/AcrR family transcriptional repressor of mexCD-oprJ operon
MAQTPALRDRVARGILEVAAQVFAEHGEAASMTDVAQAAGVGRATLYRYFPSRDALLRGLFEAALAEVTDRITEAQLDTVPVAEAIARATRAVLSATRKYRALGLFTKSPDDSRQAEQTLMGPMRTLIERAGAEGAFRTDLSSEAIAEVYFGMLEGAVARVTQGRLGTETAATALTTIFLTGATTRDGIVGRLQGKPGED